LSSPWRPALRPEIERRERGGKLASLWDPLTEREINVGPVTRAVISALDGRTIDEVLEKAKLALAGRRADVEDALRCLLLLSHVEGAGREHVEALRANARGERRLEPLALPESRFTCQGSGACCRVYDFGPLDDEDVARLNALPIAEKLPDVGPGPYVRKEQSVEGNDAWYLERRDERCVFLGEDRLCRIHKTFGVEAKPTVCRLFPWRIQVTWRGIKVFDQSECSTFATSALDGEPLASQLAPVLALVPERPKLHHPAMLLDREHPCDYGWLAPLQDRMVALLGRPDASVGAALVAAGRLARAWVDALVSCPIAEGEPDATAARALSAAGQLDPRAPAPTAKGRETVARVCAAIVQTIRERELKGSLAPELADALALAKAMATGELDGEGRATMDVKIDSALLERALRVSLRAWVFGERLMIQGRLQPGFLCMALVPLATVAGAKLRARRRGATGTTREDLSLAHRAAVVGLRHPKLRDDLIAYEELCWETLDATAGIAGV
jgi:Fe-S-cluster containining protein